jgi:hypothetical protein
MSENKKLVVLIDGEPFKHASADTLTQLGEPEPEMFSFEWTCRELGLPVPEARNDSLEPTLAEQIDNLERNRDEEAWEAEQAQEHAREQARQPNHD